jgi:DNA polymerase-3 subunit gamma/tau
VEHLALYREWRPQFFREVIGQEHVCRTLRNAVSQGRTAHAYLFCGPRGTGKTSTARILAKAVNCPNGEDGEPCNNCPSCQDTTAGISLDVIEMDAASHRGIEEIRDLNQKVCFAPTAGKSRFFIIDEVHMLTGEAFNALLKTLEEPPRHAVFVLATTEAHKVPLTIMSRCQRFDFRRLGRETIKEHLRRVAGEKGWQIDDEALDLLGRHAAGALRDALGLLEQAASFTGGAITRTDLEALTGAMSPDGLKALLHAAMTGDVPSLLQQLDGLLAGGCEPRQVLFQLIDQVRDRLFASAAPGSERTAHAGLLRCLASAEVDLKGNSRPDLVLELALVRFADALAASASPAAPVSPAQGKGLHLPAGTGVAPVAGGRDMRAAAPARAPRAASPERAATASGSAVDETAAAIDLQSSPQAQAALTRPTPEEPPPETSSATPETPASPPEARSAQAPETLTPPPPETPPAQAPANFAEIKKALGRGLQKQKHPLLLQALASCMLRQDGNRITIKASNVFLQDILLKDENRCMLQGALRQYHPSLELEITGTDGSPGQTGPRNEEAAPSGFPAREEAPDAGRRSASNSPGGTQIPGGAQEPAPEQGSGPQPLPEQELTGSQEPLPEQALAGAQEPAAPDRRPQKPQAGRGQQNDPVDDDAAGIDPVGIALTLFGGKIINETENGG